jgi:hypothetical protein
MSGSEKVSFNQLNRKTGDRIKYAKVDADTARLNVPTLMSKKRRSQSKKLHQGLKPSASPRLKLHAATPCENSGKPCCSRW